MVCVSDDKSERSCFELSRVRVAYNIDLKTCGLERTLRPEHPRSPTHLHGACSKGRWRPRLVSPIR